MTHPAPSSRWDREVATSGWMADALEEIHTIGTASSDPLPGRGASPSPSAPPKIPTKPTTPASPATTFGGAEAAPPAYVRDEPPPPAFDSERPGFVFFGARPQRFFHLDHIDPVSVASTATRRRRRRKRGAPWEQHHRTWMWLGGLGVFACFVAAGGLTVASLKLLDDKDVGYAG